MIGSAIQRWEAYNNSTIIISIMISYTYVNILFVNSVQALRHRWRRSRRRSISV